MAVFDGHGSSETGRLIAALDAAKTPLGPPSDWCSAVRKAVDLILPAAAQIVLFWGPDYVALYNDAYAPTIGDKHPRALGRPARENWSELWSDLGPLLESVRRTGKTFVARDRPFYIERHGYGETVYFDVSYSAVREADGTIGGVLCIVSETTERVRSQKRLAALAALNDALRDVADAAGASYVVGEVLGKALGVTRAGYGVIDPETDIMYVDRDWNAPGSESVAGAMPLRHYGKQIDDLKRGEIVAISDIGADARTAGASQALTGRGARAFVAVPLLEQGRLVAVLFVVHEAPRSWSPDDLVLIGEFAARARSAVERARSAAQLREANETLERRVAEALAERRLMAELVEATDTFIHVLDTSYRVLAINEANAREYEKIFGFRPRVGESILAQLEGRPAVRDAVHAVWKRALAGESYSVLAEFGDPDLARRWYDIKFRPLYGNDGKLIGAFQFSYDVTDRLREQARLKEAEEQLLQSQKMEAVGQLTGGIAHDFNNLLAGIAGSLELLEKRIAEGRTSGNERYITAAQMSTKRAAALTQRLLAFSRRQTLDPRPTDLNRLVSGMEDLIRRSVGPDIDVEVVGAGGLWLTKVDSSQLESALLNLCINGRDAMAPNGGRLVVETANRWLDERAAAKRELAPGQYVSLSVTDTGTGMTPEIKARIFDPFFTTKPIGEGTGLGLSMVHGFVRQSGGQVRVYSEPGKGTTMTLYLPRFVGEMESVDAAPRAESGPGDGETVLVVDDEAIVRMLIVETLEENGYRALEAHDGPSGLRILDSDVRIDLLITDVGLPGGLNGRQIADAAREKRPNLKTLFITGYAETAVIGSGHLKPGMEVLTKPFEISAITNKVRELLDR